MRFLNAPNFEGATEVLSALTVFYLSSIYALPQSHFCLGLISALSKLLTSGAKNLFN